MKQACAEPFGDSNVNQTGSLLWEAHSLVREADPLRGHPRANLIEHCPCTRDCLYTLPILTHLTLMKTYCAGTMTIPLYR